MNTFGELLVTRAATVRLPWAAMIRPGGKLVENRGRPIAEKHIGSRIGIHAAAAWSKDGAVDGRVRNRWWGPSWVTRAPLEASDFSPYFRKIVCVVRVAGCHRAVGDCCRPWGDPYYVDPAKTAWHIVFDDPTPIEPVGPVKGSLAFPWIMPQTIAAQVTIRYLDAP